MNAAITVTSRRSASRLLLVTLVLFCAQVWCPSLCAAELQPVRIGLTRSASSAAIYIAAARGYFTDQGLKAELRRYDSGLRLQKDVASGKLDVGVTDLDGSFLNFAARNHLKIFASQAFDQAGYPGTTLKASKKASASGLREWKDLGGKRIGLTTLHSGFRYGVSRIARRYGADPATIRWVAYGTVDGQIAALARGEIDAAPLPPLAAAQTRAGQAIVLGHLGDHVPWQVGAFFARAKSLRDERDTIARFVRAYQHGATEYDQNFLQRDDGGTVIEGADYGKDLALIAREVGVAPDVLETTLPWIDRLGRLYLDDIAAQLQFWQDQGQVDRSITVDTLLDMSLMSEHIGALPR